MWMLYYNVGGIKSWQKGQTKEQLEKWAEQFLPNLSPSGKLECDDFYDIVDLKRLDLVEELRETKSKLVKIQKILNA